MPAAGDIGSNNMQRIVAFVAPLRAGGRPRPAVGATSQSPGEGEGDEHSSSQPAESSELKIEAVLSDGQARRILESLLEREQYSDIDSLIHDFLEIGLELAGADACDLYETIVMAVERRLISRVYDECDHVKTKAAARLGINRNTLNKRLRQYGLPKDRFTRSHELDHMNSRQSEPIHEKD